MVMTMTRPGKRHVWASEAEIADRRERIDGLKLIPQHERIMAARLLRQLRNFMRFQLRAIDGHK